MVCERCGSCCWLGKDRSHKCKFLVLLKNGKTLCRIYKTRLGTYLGNFDGLEWYCATKETMDYQCEANNMEGKIREYEEIIIKERINMLIKSLNMLIKSLEQRRDNLKLDTEDDFLVYVGLLNKIKKTIG